MTQIADTNVILHSLLSKRLADLIIEIYPQLIGKKGKNILLFSVGAELEEKLLDLNWWVIKIAFDLKRARKIGTFLENPRYLVLGQRFPEFYSCLKTIISEKHDKVLLGSFLEFVWEDLKAIEKFGKRGEALFPPVENEFNDLKEQKAFREIAERLRSANLGGVGNKDIEHLALSHCYIIQSKMRARFYTADKEISRHANSVKISSMIPDLEIYKVEFKMMEFNEEAIKRFAPHLGAKGN